MRAKPEYRDRADTQVAVLDALADRSEEGMTVFELRTRVEADIDGLERALADLKDDDLIDVTDDGDRTLIRPDENVVGRDTPDDQRSVIEEFRRYLPF